MPTLRPILWSSPRALLSTTISCLIRSIGKKDIYLLGHLAVSLETPLIDDSNKYVAMSLVNPKDRPDGVFKRRLGFGVLGEPIRGKIESKEDLLRRLNRYAKRKKLAVMRFKVHETGMRRVLAFLDYFKMHIEGTKYAPCDFYSGVMHPIYEHEGAGCTSLGMAILEQAGVLPNFSDEWKIEYNIPMNLVGGKFNNNYSIKVRDVLSANKWHPNVPERRNIDYIECEMYDPSIMYRWIKKIHKENKNNFNLFKHNDLMGVYFDYSHCEIADYDKPLLKQRKTENFFVNQYKTLILNKV